MQEHYYKEALTAEIFSIISKAAESMQVKSFVIGGFVRDFILERGIKRY